MAPPIALHLARHADSVWTGVIRPWLEADRGNLGRSLVVVPTRGQAHMLKQRCMAEGVALLGVEFLSPGLARKKWLALSGGASPALGRELLLLGLRQLIEQRLEKLSPGEGSWGFWKSLQSDPERALDDFDELLKAGFAARDFPRDALAGIFGDLMEWVSGLGATFAPIQSKEAALKQLSGGDARIQGRVLVLGMTAESWGEFFNVAALVRRMSQISVVLPEPEFRGRGALDEKWIEVWQTLLGVEPVVVAEVSDPEKTCAPVGELWTREGGSGARARVVVGQSRTDEMALVVGEIRAMLSTGAESIGVIFPEADASHRDLVRLLADSKVPFADLIGTEGAPPVDVQAQRALLRFYERGARLDELLALWPLLRAIGLVTQPQSVARDVCERLFDDRQNHSVELAHDRLKASDRAEWKEVLRVVDILLPAWPDELTLSDALTRFERVCEALELESVTGWAALGTFAEHTDELFLREVLVKTLTSFLPAKSPVAQSHGHGGFARVTLTTRRRAEGVAWSHLIFVESNSGGWPRRRESSCWLDDEERIKLNEKGPYSLGVFTGEERSSLEKQGYANLVRDTREEVVFSAALFGDEDTEVALGPNSWLERILWAQGKAEGGLERAFQEMAQTVARTREDSLPEKWLEIWQGRRDPDHGFDEWFLSGDAKVVWPERLAARAIEDGVRDPAELWFSGVLGTRRVAVEPLVRSKAKALGQWSHRMLAATLRPEEILPSGFGEMPAQDAAKEALEQRLAYWRARWPVNCYWDSFHEELATICRELLSQVYAIDAGKYVATEMKLPGSAVLGLDGTKLPVAGRMDLVRSDLPEWRGATVDVFDFKTGGDAKLSVKRMAEHGDSLQLGVYLEAVRSLGVSDGRVWMLKPKEGGGSSMGVSELPMALALLGRLKLMQTTGRYGALTPERSAYGQGGFEWPLACTPVPYATLKTKYAVTFPEPPEEEVSDG